MTLPVDQWIERVTAYADGLETVATQMIEAMARTKKVIEANDGDAVRTEAQQTEGLLRLLEGACEKRAELLNVYPAPEVPADLRSALRALGPEQMKLAERLDQIGAVMADAQQRATALFITNYHLLETRNELLRLITTGNAVAPTYDRSPDPGACILDRAA